MGSGRTRGKATQQPMVKLDQHRIRNLGGSPAQVDRDVDTTFPWRREEQMAPSDSPRGLTLEALFAQPDNEAVLRHLKIHRPEDARRFEAGTDGSPFDEGGQIFFHRYGRKVPASARCSVQVCNLLAHERTARIFALHEGRFTIALRPDLSRWDDSSDCFLFGLRGETLDGTVDLSLLGPGWKLFAADGAAEAAEAFLRAYELAGR